MYSLIARVPFLLISFNSRLHTLCVCEELRGDVRQQCARARHRTAATSQFMLTTCRALSGTFRRRFNSVMIGALGSSLLRAAPATHASLFRPLPMAAPHAARGIAAAALPHRIAVRRAPLARLLSGEADRTVVEKATTLIKKALSPKEVKIQVCVPASPLRGRRVHRRQALC